MNTKIIVTITPLKLEYDSRTFKQASSIARFGYTSIVIETGSSSMNTNNLLFTIHSIEDFTSYPNMSSIINTVNKDIGKKVDAQENLSKSFLDNKFTNPINRSNQILSISNFKKQIKKIINHPKLKTLKKILRAIFHFFAFFPFLFNYLRRSFWMPLKYLTKASLYYLHSPEQFPAIFLLSKIYNVPYVYDAHDFYPELRQKSDNNFDIYWANPFYNFIERCCVNQAVAVITVADGIAELYHNQFGCNPIVIRNCHDFRLDTQPSQDIRKLIGLTDQDFLLVNIGNAKHGQAIENILDAMRFMPENIHLACLGKNYEQYLDKVYRLNISKRVHLVPPVKPSEVVPFVKTANISLVLYYSESENYEYCLPNKFFQSIAAELPMLYPNLSEISKIANQYDLGIQIDPQNVESIYQGIMKLISDKALVEYYKNKLSIAKIKLSWENEDILLRDLLEHIGIKNV